jgi:uncharacterized protein (DUF2345 family)
MQASGNGAGAYSQLVFDDSPGQARVALQRHAKAHRGTAELNLGHLVHQADNRRLGVVGLGAELKAEHGVAVRAARGLLVATDRASVDGSALESGPATAQVEQSHTLQTSLAETAGKHNAKLAGEPAADKLPAIAALAAAGEVLASTSTAGADGRTGSDAAAAYAQPQLQLYAPAGVAALTPASTVVSAGATTAFTAGQDIGFAAQGSLSHSVRAGISLFTYGKAGSDSKPNQETGIRLHAASGKVSTQSQSGQTRLTADKTVTVASVTNSVNVAAKEHVLLTAQGAYIRLSGGDIEVHGPGKIEFKASMKELTGPASNELDLPIMPQLNHRFGQRFKLQGAFGAPLVNQAYTIYVADHQEIKGVTGSSGMTAHVDTENPETTYIIFDRDLQWICEEETNDDASHNEC